jgi:hypothetical protein
MTDRDYFAAAALTRGMGVLGYDQIAKSCYEMADAMLRERERTNHDAVPAARAAEPESSVPLGSGAALANTQTAPPCVETDDPPSKGEGFHIPDSRTRDICERLRRWCHAVDAESAQDLMDDAANEINRLRIREYEREAIAEAATAVMLDDDSNWTTLNELLERTK